MQTMNFPYKTSAGKKLLRDCFPMFETASKRNLFAGIFTVLTVGVMALFFSIYEPWQPIGPELIPDGSFSTPAATNVWSGWNELAQLAPDGGFGGSPGVVLTTSSNKRGILRFTVSNMTNIPAFRVSLRAAAQGVVQGKESYHVPRTIFLYQNARAKNISGWHHTAVCIQNDTDWRYYKDFFTVPKGAVSAQLHVQNLGVAGVMQIDDVSVIPVRERSDAPWWKLLFGTLWTTAFGLCLFALRPWARRYGLLIMLTLALIMTCIVLPGKLLDGTIKKTVQTARGLLQKPVAAPQPPVQIAKTTPAQPGAPQPAKTKEEVAIDLIEAGVERTHLIGHLTLFSLLAFLSALSWISAPYSLRHAGEVFAGLVFFAAATEVLQFIPPDRSAGLSDLSIDVFGMAGAVVLVLLLRGIQRLITRYKH
jgi:VanZ family protein